MSDEMDDRDDNRELYIRGWGTGKKMATFDQLTYIGSLVDQGHLAQSDFPRKAFETRKLLTRRKADRLIKLAQERKSARKEQP